MMVLVTGGSGSGKSAYAEDAVLRLEPRETARIYIATMFPYDWESRQRILRHQRLRKDKHFQTIECFTNLETLSLPQDCTVLLECMSNLVANEMFMEEGAKDHTLQKICDGIRFLNERTRNLVIVTNEIFSEAEVHEGDTRTYLENLGTINQYCAKLADSVYEVVYGIPIAQKGVFSE